MSTHRTGIVIFQPRFQTTRVEWVPTRHEHCLFTYCELCQTHWASGTLYATVIIALTMLCADFDYRQFIHCFGVGRPTICLFVGHLHMSYYFCEKIVVLASMEWSKVLCKHRREVIKSSEPTWAKTRIHSVKIWPSSRLWLLSAKKIAKHRLERIRKHWHLRITWSWLLLLVLICLLPEESSLIKRTSENEFKWISLLMLTSPLKRIRVILFPGRYPLPKHVLTGRLGRLMLLVKICSGVAHIISPFARLVNSRRLNFNFFSLYGGLVLWSDFFHNELYSKRLTKFTLDVVKVNHVGLLLLAAMAVYSTVANPIALWLNHSWWFV